MAEPAQVQPWKAAKIPRAPETFTIYVGSDNYPLLEEYRKIVERDGHSLSSEILSFITNEVKKRSPGNPQTPLDKFDRTPEEDFRRMTLSQLSQLYEDLKARFFRDQRETVPEDELARFKRIHYEMERRDRISRLW